MDNVATVLMIAPVAMAVCKKLDTNPVPVIIAIAVSSNLQGAATLVGDTTAIMLGSSLDMSFLDFFWYQGKLSIFFAVELGAVISAVILYFIFRKEKAPIPRIGEMTKVTDYVPTVLLVGAIGLLVCASFAPERWNLPAEINGIICCVLMVVGLIYNLIKEKKLSAVTGPLKFIDFETLGLLVGLFLMIGGLENEGVIKALGDLLAKLGGNSPFLMYTIIVWASVLISAFIDNIPYVATMMPVIAVLGANMGIDPPPSISVCCRVRPWAATALPSVPRQTSRVSVSFAGTVTRSRTATSSASVFPLPWRLSCLPTYIYIWLVYGV